MKTVMLSLAETAILNGFIDTLDDEFASAGCNDFTARFDPKNKDDVTFAMEFAAYLKAEDADVDLKQIIDYKRGVITTEDFTMLNFLKRRFK